MSSNKGIAGPIKGIMDQLVILQRIHAEKEKDYAKGRQDGIWAMKWLVEKVAVMTVEERKEAFGILSMESLFTSRTYDQIKEAYDAWQARPKEEICQNCAHCLWYAREDGDTTYLCMVGQPERSVRVTIPELTCDGWKGKNDEGSD